MLTFISFFLSFFGTLNWFFIATFQYDIVAGFFGTQASLFSRIIYFLIGIAGFVLLVMAFKNKGYIKITENAFKKKQPQNNKPQNNDTGDFDNDEITVAKPIQEGYKDFDFSKYDEN